VRAVGALAVGAVRRPVDLAAARVGQDEESVARRDVGRDRVEAADGVHRDTEGVPERGGGGHPGAQPGEGAGAHTGDDRVEILEGDAGGFGGGPHVRGDQLAVGAGVDRDAVTARLDPVAVHCDDARGHRRCRSIDRQYQHGGPAYDQARNCSLQGTDQHGTVPIVTNPTTVTAEWLRSNGRVPRGGSTYFWPY
jgi:hypothetical protein